MSTRRFRITDSQTARQDIEEKKIDIPVVDNTEARKQLIARIESVTSDVIRQICSGSLPKISYSVPKRDAQAAEENGESENLEEASRVFNGSESTEQTTDFAKRKSKEKFALMMTVMASAHRLLITNSTITRRSLYYDLKNEKTRNLIPEQRYLDQAVNHVASLLDCAPWELNLLPTSKGLVAGELTLTLVGNKVIDCTVPGGVLIPHIASNVISVRARAKMVLIVEKDAVFQKLLEDDCIGSLNCILVTGKGYPDVATRMLVKLLSEKLQLPVYIVVDADPFGVDVMCVYRWKLLLSHRQTSFGSNALFKERESLACPNARWLGIHPSELLALGVKTVPLTEHDLSRLAILESRPYASDAIIKELRIMRNGKAEIENVASFSRKFLAATYLPCKIKGDDYI